MNKQKPTNFKEVYHHLAEKSIEANKNLSKFINVSSRYEKNDVISKLANGNGKIILMVYSNNIHRYEASPQCYKLQQRSFQGGWSNIHSSSRQKTS